MSHFHVLLIVWAKSQDSVHKPQFMKRKESRSGSNRGPSAYQPSALPLGHTSLAGALSELGHSLQILLFCQLFHNMFAQMTYPELDILSHSVYGEKEMTGMGMAVVLNSEVFS